MAANYQTNLLPISAFYLTTAERHLPLLLVDATGRPRLHRPVPCVRAGERATQCPRRLARLT